MNAECLRIAAQMRYAFEGKAWHGSAVLELLHGVGAAEAAAHPLKDAHSIAELVMHIGVWEQVALDAIKGTPMPKALPPEQNFPAASTGDEESWLQEVQQLGDRNRRLCNAIESFGDERLDEIVLGRKYNFYTLLHGVVQHSLYHAGQIAILRKAA
jgi:uncharacterized damage-inducible protein DinB